MLLQVLLPSIRGPTRRPVSGEVSIIIVKQTLDIVGYMLDNVGH